MDGEISEKGGSGVGRGRVYKRAWPASMARSWGTGTLASARIRMALPHHWFLAARSSVVMTGRASALSPSLPLWAWRPVTLVPKVSWPLRPMQFDHVLAEYPLAAGAMFDQAMTHGAVHSNFPVRKIMRKGNAYRARRREVALDFLLKIWGNIYLLGLGWMLDSILV